MTFVGRPYTLRAPESPNMTRLVPFDRHLSAIRWQFIRGFLIGILASSAVAIPAFKYSNVRQHKASLQGVGQTAVENSAAKAVSGALKSTSVTARTSVPPTILPKPELSKPSNHFLDNPAERAPARDRLKSPVPSDVGQAAPLTNLSFPEPRPTKKTLAMLAQLWASFEAGNTKAAVALAELYLRGDGVPVNCEQARVLLFVASKENDAEATKKLQDLDETGCPAP
jgi:TPR repeat protein